MLCPSGRRRKVQLHQLELQVCQQHQGGPRSWIQMHPATKTLWQRKEYKEKESKDGNDMDEDPAPKPSEKTKARAGGSNPYKTP
jgi:hypothetical protein